MRTIFIFCLFSVACHAQVFPPAFWAPATTAGGGGGGFTYYSVGLDGSSAYLSRGADLTGVSDSGKFTLSVWLKATDYSGNHTIIGNTSFGFPGLDFYFDNTTAVRMRAWDNAGDNSLGDPLFPAIASTGWVHWLISVDCGGTTCVYTNDVLFLSCSSHFSTGSIDLTKGDFFIGAFGAPNGFFLGKMCEFWLCIGTAIDISNSTNRRKFISGTGHPVNLGSDGSTPTGSQPAIYLHNQYNNWFSNLGSGGGFTAHGTFSDGGADIP